MKEAIKSIDIKAIAKYMAHKIYIFLKLFITWTYKIIATICKITFKLCKIVFISIIATPFIALYFGLTHKQD